MSKYAHDFHPGQRWLSNTQSELGLGTVVGIEERCVRMAFPAAGETRLYAVNNAPLTRVTFAPGDRVRDQTERQLIVISANDADGLYTYECEDLDGQIRRISEAELNDNLRLNRPREKLLSGRIDRDAWFSLRLETWQRAAAAAASPVYGLAGPRVSLIPHQLYVAAEVANRYAPRVLLADEVGLGKTIEAGLILHRLLICGRAARVLILVPEALLHQWLVEMLRRFNLPFTLFDAPRVKAAQTDNPFRSAQHVLCGPKLLLDEPQVARAAIAGDWDLLIVDEAHHYAWSEHGSSPEYDLIEALAEVTPGVLLLTATPEQFGRSGHFGRLRLLDPQRFPSYETFIAEELRYQPIARLSKQLIEGQALNPEEQSQLDALLGDDSTKDAAQLLGRLIDRHGTGRVLFRNTRAAITGFPQRRLHAYPLPTPQAYAATNAEVVDRLTPETASGDGWADFDPRVAWLTERLRALQPAKVLVICALANTACQLRDRLYGREAIHAAIFHEHMEIVERDRAAAYFADIEEGTQVLICSEIGSEGRNFQFAHHLVLFDLPLAPDLLEQRIGRLDRIGQKAVIEIHVPYLQGHASEVLYRWYATGLQAFESTCPAAGTLFNEFRDDLLAALGAPERTEPLLAAVAARRTALHQELANGRDRLLELHSHRADASGLLIEAIETQDADRGAQAYMTRYWDFYGVEQEPGPNLSVILHPGSHMYQDDFPGLPADGVTVTFDRANALAHEDREFLTWEHPMVRQSMEMLTTSDLGSTAVTALQDRRFKPGSLFLELIFVADCPAPALLQADRFLPPTPMRLLIDAQGNDRSAEFDHQALLGTCMTRNRKLVKAIIKSQADRLTQMLEVGERLAYQTTHAFQQDAARRVNDVLGEELDRLEELARVNANVRAEELEFLQVQLRQLQQAIAKTQPHLDALRVIITH